MIDINLMELLGVAILSLLYCAYLFLSKQKSFALRYTSLYICVCAVILVVALQVLVDSSLFITLFKCLVTIVYVGLYSLCSRHKLSSGEKSWLLLVGAVGLAPLLINMVVIISFMLGGSNM